MKNQISDNKMMSASGGAIPKGREEEFDETAANAAKLWTELSEEEQNDVREYFDAKYNKKRKKK